MTRAGWSGGRPRRLARFGVVGMALITALMAGPAAWGQGAGAQAARLSTSGDPRYFEATAFRVGNDAFWTYFNQRGGVKTFGYPISRSFTLEGSEVQLFQRFALQLGPDQTPRILNLLDPDLMAVESINFSRVPPVDPSLKAATPKVGEPDYHPRMLAFIRAQVPDELEGVPVGFLRTFLETVQCQHAFPDAPCREELLPGLALEVWGAPTSRPARDPANPRFFYQRFQRGIMHYAAQEGLTQGMLVGQYFKSVLTGQYLPDDLAASMRGSRFYRQYAPTASRGLAAPSRLPNTDLRGAFEPDVALPSVSG